MPFQPTIDGALAVVKFTRSTYEWTNHLWYRMEDFSAADMLLLANGVLTGFKEQLDGYYNEDVTYGPVYVYDMREEDGEVVVSTEGVGHGDQENDILPPGVCCVLTLRTIKRGRSYRGRVYLAGFCEVSMDNGRWGSSLRGAVANLGSDLMWRPLESDWVFCVRSGWHNHIKRESAVLEEIISTEVRSEEPGFQRRRVPRG